MNEREKYERPEVQVIEIPKESAILTSGGDSCIIYMCPSAYSASGY